MENMKDFRKKEEIENAGFMIYVNSMLHSYFMMQLIDTLEETQRGSALARIQSYTASVDN